MAYERKREKRANTGRTGHFASKPGGYQPEAPEVNARPIPGLLVRKPGAAQGAEIGGREAVEELWQRGQQAVKGVDVERLLSVVEAAALLNVQPATLYVWVAQRKIPHRKIGRLVRFRMIDLEAWVDQQRVEPGSEKK